MVRKGLSQSNLIAARDRVMKRFPLVHPDCVASPEQIKAVQSDHEGYVKCKTRAGCSSPANKLHQSSFRLPLTKDPLFTPSPYLHRCRFQIGRGLKVTHKQLGNHQLVSQFLAMLGGVNRVLNDLPAAADVLKSAFTLAKSQHDLLAQVGALQEVASEFLFFFLITF